MYSTTGADAAYIAGEQEITLVAVKRSIAAVLLRCLLYSTVQYLASLVVVKKSAIAVSLSYLQLAL